MLNFLVESKKEYTELLYSNIYKKIYEGFSKIYGDVVKNKEIESVDKMKSFQKLLSTIPKWKFEDKQREYNRIFANKKNLQDLVRALVKAHIIILTYSPFKNKNTQINQNLYMNADLIELNFKIHVACARRFYNNPLLFYKEYEAGTILENQRKAFELIKLSIEDAIREILPIEFILNTYLDEDSEESPKKEDNLNQKYNLTNNFQVQTNNPIENNLLENKNIINEKQENPKLEIKNNEINNFIKPEDLINNNQMGGSIQEILNRNNIKISDTQSNLLEELTNNNTKELHQSKKSTKEESIDSKIKNILEKDLKETDLDISLSYKPEESENYQEVFSNSTNKSKKSEVHDSMNTADRDELKKKNKFFNNYLSF